MIAVSLEMSDEPKIVALLHDTIEDTGMTPEKLLQLGYTQDTVDAILSVTRKEGESYADFICKSQHESNRKARENS